NAAPVSYLQDGKQYVLVPIGAGGGAQFVYPELHASQQGDGRARLLAFSLDGHLELRREILKARQLSALRPTAEDSVVQRGEKIYWDSCRYCHGKDVVARAGGSVPDLRFASEETHAAWNAIVVGGAKRLNGMPGSEMSREDAEAVR